ncbi:MAG: tRNA adenosine(34) deaminase TadA [Acidobacteriota bacterium]
MEEWMQLALEEAGRAEQEGEVPIGAVAVVGERVIAKNHNRSIQLNDPTAHAELLVLRQAGHLLSNYRLNDLDIYVTIEPCAMCAGALLWARVRRLVFGARDSKTGAVFSKVSLLTEGLFNHDVEVIEGILAEPCRQMLQDFFADRRPSSPDYA